MKQIPTPRPPEKPVKASVPAGLLRIPAPGLPSSSSTILAEIELSENPEECFRSTNERPQTAMDTPKPQ